jgi:hypothetical protein
MTVLEPQQQQQVRPGAFCEYPGGRACNDVEEDASTHHAASPHQPPAQDSSDSAQNIIVPVAYLVDEVAQPLRQKRQFLLAAAVVVIIALVVGL